MPTVCIQCAMKALLAGTPVPAFDESPEEHQRIHHPDPVETMMERRELEAKLSERIKKGDMS